MSSRRKFLTTASALSAGLVLGEDSAADPEPRIQTARGPVSPRDLGRTLIHEHVLVDFIGAERASRSRYDADEVFRMALPHMRKLRELGCRTLVECTPAYLGRDPALLRRLSEASGVRLLTNTGYYGASGGKYLPAHARTDSAEQLAARWTAEARDGSEGTGIRPGFIKIGVDVAPLPEINRKLVRAAALTPTASTITSAPSATSSPAARTRRGSSACGTGWAPPSPGWRVRASRGSACRGTRSSPRPIAMVSTPRSSRGWCAASAEARWEQRALRLSRPPVRAREIRLALSAARMADRQNLLQRLDDARRQAEPLAPEYGELQARAFELLTGAASRAFDIRREPAAQIERYDTSMIRVGKEVFEPSTLGSQMLLARRLVEHGANFVTVQSAGWDMHADENNPGVLDGMRMLGPTVDKAVSAFLTDLADRGLLEQTLLVITGDFGRSPKINRGGGRDHWRRLSTLALAGGGLPGGQVIGQSDPTGAEPDSDPITPAHLFSTVIHHLFDAAALRARADLPPEVARILETSRPIAA